MGFGGSVQSTTISNFVPKILQCRTISCSKDALECLSFKVIASFRDIKSYLSQAYLYFAPISGTFIILVDNQSWRMNNHSISIHLWELLLAKYRMSPFRNTKSLLNASSFGPRDACSKSSSDEGKKLLRWLSIINTSWKTKPLFSLRDLHKALHGFIVFEVAWKDVNGINYLNQLQTDTSLALEVKCMRKWEFHSIDQALSSIMVWFSGTTTETQMLKHNLAILHEKVPSHSSWGIKSDSREALVLSDDVFFDVRKCTGDSNHATCVDDLLGEEVDEAKESYMENDDDIEFMQYEDKLLQFQFTDRNLPFILKDIITSNLKLLTLLESGLPSWVIFLQSYPLCSRVYRPWMRLLARTLYILISLVTVMIGFYDLYKNVPLLKETASHICGPLFQWVETWEMISRIKYLGTMLFLQNFEMAVIWFLKFSQMMKLLVLLLTRPLVGPFKEFIEFASPMWSILAEAKLQIYGMAWFMVESLFSIIVDSVFVLLSPFGLLFTYISDSATMVSPIFSSTWKLLLMPIQMILVVANYVSALLSEFYDLLESILRMAISSVGQLRYFSQVTHSSSEISIWHSLWKDLLSKVFKSLRSIIYGLSEFFASCNRHRLRWSAENAAVANRFIRPQTTHKCQGAFVNYPTK
ncbi:hypothetical protein RJ641_030050, partial [Dillenia turbinata]